MSKETLGIIFLFLIGVSITGVIQFSQPIIDSLPEELRNYFSFAMWFGTIVLIVLIWQWLENKLYS